MVAVAIALHDYQAQAGRMPLARLLGGSPERVLTYPRVVSVGEPVAMAPSTSRVMDDGAGFRTVQGPGATVESR